MTTIAIDALGVDKPGGTRTSILNTLAAQFELDRDRRYIVYLSQPEPILESFPHVEPRIIKLRNRFLVRIWLQLILPLVLRRDRVSLVHYTKSLGTFFTPGRARSCWICRSETAVFRSPRRIAGASRERNRLQTISS